MSLNELLITLIGLVAGWAIVSITVSIRRKRSAATLSGEWFEILGVPPDAALDQIDEAYERRFRILKESEPSIKTVSEDRAFLQKQGALDIAYRTAKEMHRKE
jgi:uncharacterized protein (DUF927 family)